MRLRCFRDAEPITPALPVGPLGPTSYAQKSGSVVDSQPRVISNLIVDQTSTNPAAIAAAGFPVRTQGNPGVVPVHTDPDPPRIRRSTACPPAACPAHQTLFIPNVTTDVGLSPPYNILFTFFGQFFDHGVDQTVKSGGTVFVPLKADDPLITPVPTASPAPATRCRRARRFMVLTRAQNQPGPDGSPRHPHADDKSRTPTTPTRPGSTRARPTPRTPRTRCSCASTQLNAADHPVSTGKLLGGLVADDPLPAPPATCSTTATPHGKHRHVGGRSRSRPPRSSACCCVDKDVTNIPMLAADPYGKFIPGPPRGLPQYVTDARGLVEGNLASPVPVPANVVHFDTPFLTDIAHNADPRRRTPTTTRRRRRSPRRRTRTPPPRPTSRTSRPAPTTTRCSNDHFICGDGRCNENIALSAIHQIFHSEHDRLVDDIKNMLTNDTTPAGARGARAVAAADRRAPDGWNGERLFQAARFVTEMEYQHLVFEEFARKIQPAVRPFHVYTPDINPAIPAEFAHAVYRFGHSMLDDDVARTNDDAPGQDATTRCRCSPRS